MTEKKRKIHVIGINSYKFEDLPPKLQNLFRETVSIAVPNSYFEKIKSWSQNNLYPYIREILKSKEDLEKNADIWNDFNKRLIDLIKERFNLDSMKVKKLLNQKENEEIIIKYLLTLSLCVSKQGFQKLKNFLFDF